VPVPASLPLRRTSHTAGDEGGCNGGEDHGLLSLEVVAQAGSLEEARGMLEGIDVAIVDLGLPDGYGGDLIRDLREANPRASENPVPANFREHHF
jgi:DNA-binding NarL/FixJ family response regulator